jgi:ribonuclease J
MARPTITFLGGVREIGGNKILITDGPDRILFDFGPSFSPRMEEFYVDFLQPRSTSRVKDLLEFDLLPRVDGLYSEAALADSDLRYQAPEIHAIFVSHAHADHAGYLDLIDPGIPIYLGLGTRRLLEAIEASGTRKYGAHDWRIFVDRQPIRIGGLEVIPYPVDHSIPWAYGFLIRTSAGTVVYTGDFRRHGPRARDTDTFLNAAQVDRPVALVIEGTRAGPDPRKNLSEQEVGAQVDSVLQSTDSVALVCTYPRDVDRLTTLYQAALQSERELVVSLKAAHLLATIAPLAPTPSLPVPGKRPSVRVYGRTKRRYYNWEKPFLPDAITAEEIRTHGSRYLLSLDLMHFAELIDIRPPAGSPFIHSMSEPFSEEDINDRVLHNWLEHFGLPFHQMHASGHCSGPELLEISRTLAPENLFPIHTEHPEAFLGLGTFVRPPEKGTPYPLGP